MAKIGGLVLGGLFLAIVGLVAGPARAQPYEMSCIHISELRASDTPRRLARSVRDCIAQERYDEAMQLFLGYSSFGTFDQQRVRDVSGHMEFVELNSWIFGGYRRSVIDALRLSADRLRDHESEIFHATCTAIRGAGFPTYRPTYMIKRGMMPRKNDDDWMSEGFDAAAAWEAALVEVNGCPTE